MYLDAKKSKILKKENLNENLVVDTNKNKDTIININPTSKDQTPNKNIKSE